MIPLVFNFAFLSVNVSIVPILTIVLSNHDIDYAAEFSSIFAVVSLVFSIALLNQRNYLCINGDSKYSFTNQLFFRYVNCAIGFFLIIGYYFIEGSFSNLVLLVILIKLSELNIDYFHAAQTYTVGSTSASKSSFVKAFLRSSIIVVAFIFLKTDFVLFLICLALLVFTTIDVGMKYSFRNGHVFFPYLSISNDIKTLGAIGLFTSIFSLLPRLLLDENNDQIELISLSLTPLFGLVLQSVWLTSVSKLRTYSFDRYLIYAISICMLTCLLFLLLRVSTFIPEKIYGIDQAESINVFLNTLSASIFIFLPTALSNLLKIINPKFDLLVYITGILAFILFFNYDFDLSVVFYLTTILMLFVFVLGWFLHE